MSPQQLAVALWKLLESAGLEPSMSSIARTLRLHGVSFTDRTLRGWLDAFASAQRKSSPRRASLRRTPPHFSSTNAALRRTSPDSAAAYAREKEVSLFSSSSDSLRSSATTGRSRKTGHTDDTAWVEPLVASAQRLRDIHVRALSVEQRFTLGRYHALKFGGCTRSEHTNKLKATTISKSLASLGQAHEFADLTVGEYVTYARKVHELRAGAVWYDAWLIKAVVEYDAGAAS